MTSRIFAGLAGPRAPTALSKDFEDLRKQTNMVKCGLPFAKDVPDDFEIIYFDNLRPNGPFVASCVGELPNTSSERFTICKTHWHVVLTQSIS